MEPQEPRFNWREMLAITVLGLALGAAMSLLLLFTPDRAWGSGPRRLVFNQPADCTFVARWETAYEPTGTAGTLPSSAAAKVLVENAAPVVCGPGITAVSGFLGVGPTRFWLRAIATDGSTSAWSNSVDAPLPFAAPALVSVGG